MQCPRCQTENREGRRFCSECGLSLGSVCEACGFYRDREVIAKAEETEA